MSEMREVYDTAYMIIKQLIREVEQVTERLTEKTDKGIWVKESHGENVIKTLYQCYGAEPLPDYSNCDEGYLAMEKLLEYESAEEDGRLVVLPCKVGTRVYEIYQFCGYGVWEIDEHKIKLEDLDKIGKTIFLTRKEAEKALKEMKTE